MKVAAFNQAVELFKFWMKCKMERFYYELHCFLSNLFVFNSKIQIKFTLFIYYTYSLVNQSKKWKLLIYDVISSTKIHKRIMYPQSV